MSETSSAEQPAHTNRLAREKSPYLLQHAHNPVDWFPWGPEAFEQARATDRPILLSIGYATCHWCHVMERESFENQETAAILNEKFVAIKVDREERPDVDQIYMKALHATGQQGGWPLNMFLTPDLLPITGGTYFPPQPAYGRPSFAQVLQSIDDLWRNNRQKIRESADALHGFLQQSERPANPELPGPDALDHTFALYEKLYDPYRGGFAGNGPNKFPPSMGLVFLLEYYRRTGQARALQMVEETLEHMKRGGIYDQIGGGISRYATDHDWLVPHFEKMLYDNALFVRALVECFRVTGNERYKTWALDVCDYIQRDMTAPEGAFYSAEDADSEGVEGKFYVWTAAEIDAVFSAAGIPVADRKLLLEFWGVTARGNFEGHNILHEVVPHERFLAGCGKTAAEWENLLATARAALLVERSKRVRPLRDDKILTSWNALYIIALAQAARAFQDPTLYRRARVAADFLWNNMRAPDGSLYRRYREGEAGVAATLPDYALLANACLDLYRAGFEPTDFARATQLAAIIEERFLDPAGSGAFFETPADSPDLIVRTTETYDGVEPSGNSAAARLFLTLALYGHRPAHNRALAEGVLKYARTALGEQGASHAWLANVLSVYLSPPPEIAVVLPGTNSDPTPGPAGLTPPEAEVLGVLGSLSGDSIQAICHRDNQSLAAQTVPLLEQRDALHEQMTIYVCRDLSCKQPVHSAGELQQLLGDSKVH